jgi:hypothetical protein
MIGQMAYQSTFVYVISGQSDELLGRLPLHYRITSYYLVLVFILHIFA